MNITGFSMNQNRKCPSPRPQFGALEVKLSVDPSPRHSDSIVINTLKDHFPEGTQTTFRKNDSEVRIAANSTHFESVIEQMLKAAGFKSIKKVDDTPEEAEKKVIHSRITEGLFVASEYKAESLRLLGSIPHSS
ncbi:MAG: hypothetical protein K2X66_00205, partial [Cyanobacteria bacterium]|nr:hypothetical protein [Cyanobacteriota bacterium]